MTIKEYKEALNKGTRKAAVATQFQNRLSYVLQYYFEHVKDEDGNYVYDDDGNAVLDMTKPKEVWYVDDEGCAELAVELYDVVLNAIEKWMVKLDK